MRTDHLNTMAVCVRWFPTHLVFSPETWNPVQIQNLFISHGLFNNIHDERTLGQFGDEGKWVVSSGLSRLVDDALFEMYLTSLFPNWDHFSPTTKFNLVFNDFNVWDANRMRRLVRRQGKISEDDIRIWRKDGLSLWHWISACFGAWSTRYSFVRHDYEDWKELLFEIGKLVDDFHEEHTMPWFQSSLWSQREWYPSGMAIRLKGFHKATPFICMLLTFGPYEGYKVFENHIVSFLSVLERCGLDLQKFGRREFDTWEHEYGAIHNTDAQYVAIGHWNYKTRTSSSDPLSALANLTGIHYGGRTWSFDWDCTQIHLSEDFWRMVENQSDMKPMPGAWIGDE